MALVFVGTEGMDYWNIESLPPELGYNKNTLLRLASEGHIKLSIKVPSNLRVWRITARIIDNPLRYKKDIDFGKLNYAPEQWETIDFLNLSPSDCKRVISRTCEQSVFESAYTEDSIMGDDSAILDQIMADDKASPVDLNDSLELTTEGMKFFEDAYKNEYARRFVLFHENYSMPTKGTTLKDSTLITISEDNLYIISSELKKYKQLAQSENTYPKKEKDISEHKPWESEALRILNNLHHSLHQDPPCLCSRERHQNEQNENAIQQLIDTNKGKNSEFHNLFLRLSQCDEKFYDQKALKTVKEKLQSESEELSHPRSTILSLLNLTAKEDGDQKKATKVLSAEFQEYGLSQKLSDNAASIITRSKRSQTKAASRAVSNQ